MDAVHLLRHAQPDYASGEDRGLDFRSRDTSPLSCAGAGQAREIAVQLRPLGLTMVVSSPMTRALQTAALIALELRLPLAVDIDLREWNSGPTDDATKDEWNQATEQFRQYAGRPPSGAEWEDLGQLRTRARAALERLPKGSGAALVVTHAFVIEALTGQNGRELPYCAHVVLESHG